MSFNLNGCRRKIELDDRLPVGKYGELLCSYSSNHDEFWISLIEKAYMKVSIQYTTVLVGHFREVISIT